MKTLIFWLSLETYKLWNRIPASLINFVILGIGSIVIIALIATIIRMMDISRSMQKNIHSKIFLAGIPFFIASLYCAGYVLNTWKHMQETKQELNKNSHMIIEKCTADPTHRVFGTPNRLIEKAQDLLIEGKNECINSHIDISGFSKVEAEKEAVFFCEMLEECANSIGITIKK